MKEVRKYVTKIDPSPLSAFVRVIAMPPSPFVDVHNPTSPWRACVQDEVRICHNCCHQCQLPGLLLLEKVDSVVQQQTEQTDSCCMGGWMGRRMLGLIPWAIYRMQASVVGLHVVQCTCCVNADICLHSNPPG